MSPATARHKILAIDDSPTVLKLMEMILGSEGYEIVTAADGMEGLAKAKTEDPAVVLVDFVMPKMNGFQVCKIMKETPELKDTPIILVTSKGEKVGSKFVEVLGVNEFFTKPFQPEDLLSKIQEVISKQEASEEQAVEAPGEPAVVEAQAVGATHVSPPPEPAVEAEPLPDRISSEVHAALQQAAERFFQTSFSQLLREAMDRLVPQDTNPATTPYLLSGDLHAFQVSDVLQLIGLQRHTGKLSIHRPGACLEIYFQDGMVTFATTDRQPKEETLGNLLLDNGMITPAQLQHAFQRSRQTGEPLGSVCLRERFLEGGELLTLLRRQTEQAVYQALTWRDGGFYFEREAPPYFVSELPLQIPAEDLILEGARRIDEWRAIRKRIPGLESVFKLRPGAHAAVKGLSRGETKILNLLDGKRTIRDLIKAGRMSEWDVCRILLTLLTAKLIQPRSTSVRTGGKRQAS